jgi:eukaryotic-like serine/threonine-protein kinase
MISQHPPTPTTGASNLIGVSIGDGWTITEQLPRPGTLGAEDLTGSWFSFGYIASKGKDTAFVKVIDVQGAIEKRGELSLMELLKLVTSSHIFECSILDVCKNAKLDRVVRILGKGEIPAPAHASMSIPIPYIMFEKADGDVRKIISRTNKIDDAWKFRVLHDVAVGLTQLHGQQIAHQDLKPSNVLLFDQEGKGAKIGDLGRASRRGMDVTHDGAIIAGALNYAPPEQAYGVTPERWEDRREGCDLYHLGTLAIIMFSGVTPTNHYRQHLSEDIRPYQWNGRGTCDYESALPMLAASFTAFVDGLRSNLPAWAEAELCQIIINACNPDYKKRGDSESRRKVGSPIGLDTFVSRFDRLAKRAMVEIRR